MALLFLIKMRYAHPSKMTDIVFNLSDKVFVHK